MPKNSTDQANTASVANTIPAGKNQHVKIADVKIGKEIGRGMVGTTYLATDKKGNKYAYKVEHVLDEHLEKSFKSPIWRENMFAKHMGEKYPDQFITLHDFAFDHDCSHIQQYATPVKFFDRSKREVFKRLAKSKTCIKRLYSLVDGTLTNIWHSLSKKQLYSMLIQFVNIVMLLRKHGYVHSDLHMGNIGYIKTKKKTISLKGIGKNTSVETYGYIFKAIDYGLVKNITYKHMLNDTELKEFSNNDLANLIYWAFNHATYYEYEKAMQDKHGKIGPATFKEYDAAFNKTPEKLILEKITPVISAQHVLFGLLYPAAEQKMMLGKHFNPKRIFYPTLLISLEEILFLATHLTDAKAIAKFLLDRLKITK